MPTLTIGRLGTVALIVVGLVIPGARPASATVHEFEVTAGSSLTIDTTVTTFGGHPTTNMCAPNSTRTSLSADLNSTGGGTVGATTLYWKDFWATTTVNHEYRIIINGGTLSITTTSITMTLTLYLQFNLCGSTPTVCQTNAVTATLSGTNPTGSLHPGASTILTLSGSTTTFTAPFTCNSIIRSKVHGKTGNITLQFHLTT